MRLCCYLTLTFLDCTENSVINMLKDVIELKDVLFKSGDSSVGIAARLQAGCLRSMGFNSCRGKRIFSFL